jgi:hypothetical protein
MNIVESQRARRMQIISSIKSMIAQRDNLDRDKLLDYLMRKYGCTRRTALEYMQVAGFK